MNTLIKGGICFLLGLIAIAAVLSASYQQGSPRVLPNKVAIPPPIDALRLGAVEKTLASIPALPNTVVTEQRFPLATAFEQKTVATKGRHTRSAKENTRGDITIHQSILLQVNKAAYQLAALPPEHHILAKEKLRESFIHLDQAGVFVLFERLVDYAKREQDLMSPTGKEASTLSELALIAKREALQKQILGQALARQLFGKQMHTERIMAKIRELESHSNIELEDKNKKIEALLNTLNDYR